MVSDAGIESEGELWAPPQHGEVLITAEQVTTRIQGMATEAIDRYAGINPLFVCLLNGAAPIGVGLMQEIARQDPTFHPEMVYMMVSTYGEGRVPSTPQVVTDVDPRTRETIAGRTVTIVDDILDEGITANFVDNLMRGRGAVDVDLVVLIQRETAKRKVYGDATIAGFTVPSELWLTGMGMDDKRVAHEGNRWLGYVAAGISLDKE
jgi:hypoxanthine phosphoribosyltransferase